MCYSRTSSAYQTWPPFWSCYYYQQVSAFWPHLHVAHQLAAPTEAIKKSLWKSRKCSNFKKSHHSWRCAPLLRVYWYVQPYSRRREKLLRGRVGGLGGSSTGSCPVQPQPWATEQRAATEKLVWSSESGLKQGICPVFVICISVVAPLFLPPLTNN